MKVFKTLKFRTPISIYSLYKISTLDLKLITPKPDAHFVYQSSVLWNIIYKKLGINNLSFKIGLTKSILKKIIHQNQHRHHEIEWFQSHDFDPHKLIKYNHSQ